MKKTKLFLILAAAFIFAACGSTGPEPVEFTIEMSEFAFTPETIEVQVGQEVTINIINNGALEHEFMIGHDAMEMDGVMSMYAEDFFAVAGVEEPEIMSGGSMDHDDGDMEDMDHGDDHGGGMDHGFMVSVKNGETASFTFVVTEEMVGEWEIGCFLDGGSHYTAGMKGTLIVNP